MSDYPQKHIDKGLSYSALKLIWRAPAMYHYQYILGNWAPDTEAKRMGSLIHTLVLEPEAYDARYYVMPECDGRTKEGKAIKAACVAEASGRVVIKQATLEQARGAAAAVLAHPVVAKAMRAPRREVEQTYTVVIDGVKFQARPDALINDRLVLEIKTTDDARPDEFARSIGKYCYDIQHALYCDVLAATGRETGAYAYAVVEPSPPHLCAVYTLHPDDIASGRLAYQQAAFLFAESVRNGRWPGLPADVQEVRLPRWQAEKRAVVRNGE